MAINAAQLVVSVKAEGIEETAAKIKSVGKSAEEAGHKQGGLLGKIGEFATGAVLAGGFSNAVGFLSGQFGDAIQQGENANTVMSQTAAVLKSTHGAAGVTSQHVEDLSNKLMNLTGIQDDTVTSTQNMLLTFTNIGSSGGVFDQATQTALDMSTALGQDTKSSAIQLGKALNDPVHGITALQRVGVSFSDKQKEMIATMVKHGNVAGAQKVILGELNKEFGGSAVAAGKANGGVKILTAQFDNAKQQVGQALIPILTKLLDKLMPLIETLAKNLPNAIQTAVNWFNAIGDKVQAVTTFFDKHKAILAGVAAMLGTVAVAILASLVPAFIAWAVTAGAAAIATIAATLPVLAVAAAVGVLVAGIYELVTHWKQVTDFLGGVWHNVVKSVTTEFDHIKLAVNVVKDALQPLLDIFNKIGNVVGGSFSKVGQGLHNLHIPGFAEGGVMQDTGLAIVGERGPELVTLPGGSRVKPLPSGGSHALTLMPAPARLMPGMMTGTVNGGQPIQVNLYLDGKKMGEALLPHQVGAIRRATGMKI